MDDVARDWKRITPSDFPPCYMTGRRFAGDVKIRKVTGLLPIGSGADFGVYNHSYDNLVCGVLERMFYAKDGPNGTLSPPIQADSGIFKTLHPFRDAVLELLPPNAPWTHQEFVAKYKDKKRRVIYTNAMNSLEITPITVEDAEVGAFCKAEKYDFRKPRVVPRIINPRQPRYNLVVGCYIKAIEHNVYEAINRLFGYTVVMKGLNASQRGESFAESFASLVDPRLWSWDCERCDQHMGVPALEFEHSWYNLHYCVRLLEELLKMQLSNKGKARCVDGLISFCIAGMRCSGDINTSLGNVIVIVSIIWGFLKENNFFDSVRLKDDGDDFLTMVEYGTDISGLAEWFRRFGHKVKLEGKGLYLEDIEFCQCKMMETSHGWRAVRKLDKVLACDILSFRSIHNESSWNVYRKAIAECGLSLAGDIPIQGEFYAALLRGAEHAKTIKDPEITGMTMLAKGMHEKLTTPTTLNRISFFKAFGVEPDHQEAIEARLREVLPVYRGMEVMETSYSLL